MIDTTNNAKRAQVDVGECSSPGSCTPRLSTTFEFTARQVRQEF